MSTPSSMPVALALWGKTPPKHRICCAYWLPDASSLITGSSDGELVLWDKFDSKSLAPRMMLLGHEAPITALSSTDYVDSTTRFVSASSDGHLILWDAVDGRSIDSVFMAQIHRHVVPFRFVGGSCLYCIGDYAEVMLIDPRDLTVLFILSARVDPEWISAITFIHSTSNEDLVCGFTFSGMMKIWKLATLEKMEGPIYEFESKNVEIWDVCSASWHPTLPAILLVFTTTSWQIFELAGLNRLVTYYSDEHICDGILLSDARTAVGRTDGAVYIYRLPQSLLKINNDFSKTSSRCLDEPILITVLQTENYPIDMWPTETIYCFGKYGVSQLVFRIDADDNIALWAIAESERNSSSQKVMLQRSLVETNMSAEWKKLECKPSSVYESEDESIIVTTLYVSHQGRLVIGCDDGCIILSYGCDTLSKQLLDVPSKGSKQLLDVPSKEVACRRLWGHTSSVTCFLYPHDEHARYDRQTLVSGSSDFSVILWNLNTGSLIYRFCSQGGPILRFLIPPDNCSPRILQTVCSIAGDNSVALFSLKENKCILLATRQIFPIVDVKWRPLDDFILLKCEDDSVYVWQMETATLERVISGQISEEVMLACEEQAGVTEIDAEAGASKAVQMMRALKNNNLMAMREGIIGGKEKTVNVVEKGMELPPPMTIQAVSKIPGSAHLVVFNIDSLIAGLFALEDELVVNENPENKSLSTILTGKQLEIRTLPVLPKIVWQTGNNLFMDVARLCMSLLHAWALDSDLDNICIKKLRLTKPSVPLCFGIVSRQGHISIYLPTARQSRKLADVSFDYFARSIRWSLSSSLTTTHLISIIAIANTLMSLRSASFETTKKNLLIRSSSQSSRSSLKDQDTDAQLKQSWSLLAALHCCLLPELIKPKESYCAPRIELIARRWQDRCLEIRMAAQALLTRELTRIDADGRHSLVRSWAPFLPTALPPILSIFGNRAVVASMNTAPGTASSPQPPPIPERADKTRHSSPLPKPRHKADFHSEKDGGVQQNRRNQATAVILLGVLGADFPDEMSKMDISRVAAQSLLELLVAPPTPLLPVQSPLRRAAIDLLGRGFSVWEPHLEITKVILTLLELATFSEKPARENPVILTPSVDAHRTARHALSLIATQRPPAVITALSKEVARYNSAVQHQTVQHSTNSPLLRCRVEVLRIIELLAEKQYADVADLIIPVGDILVHCLDTSLLKHKTLSGIFPPITKFYTVAYCANTRRIAFGGKNGAVVVHELRAAKSQTLPAHRGPVTALSFSEDGKYLASYGADDAKLLFFQNSQSFLGMGQNQLKCIKMHPAPAIFPVVSPSGTPLPFKARIVWISNKAVTLMLPNGKEIRFSL